MCWDFFSPSLLRTRYKSLFLVFSGKLHDAIMSGQVSLTVENVFVENNLFGECVFGRWMWEWCFWKSFGICFASHDVFARQQQLPNCTLFQTVLHDDVFGEKRLFLDWRRFAEYWNDAFATYANACGCGWVYFRFCFSWNLQQTLENNVHVCTCLVQACCTTE